MRANCADARELLRAALPPGWKPSRVSTVERLYSLFVGGEAKRPGAARFHLLYEDHLRLTRTRSLAEALETLESRIRHFVAERARRRVFVHAGVVGWRGRAVVMPGRSMAGKSSLVAELVRAGATYYSDEFAVLDARGRVHPFAKPISLRREGETRQEHFRVEELGGKVGVRPLPVGLVLLAGYRRGARWRPRELTPGQGVLGMLAHVVAARRQPEESLAALQRVVARARVVKSPRGEARAVAESVLRLLDEK